MKETLGFGLAAVFVFVTAGALRAQDFTAGKTAAQLFSSDCLACHRSTAGLAKTRDARTLAGFLREHYTTKPETAESLANYVLSGASPAVADKRGRGATANDAASERATEPSDRHGREAAAGEEGRGTIKPAEDQRRRRSPTMSGDGEKPHVPQVQAASRRDETAPPANVIASPPTEPGPAVASREVPRAPVREESPRSDPALNAGNSAVAPQLDPLAKLKAYAAQGLDIQGTAIAVGSSTDKDRQSPPGAPESAAPAEEPAAAAGAAVPTDVPDLPAAPGSRAATAASAAPGAFAAPTAAAVHRGAGPSTGAAPTAAASRVPPARPRNPAARVAPGAAPARAAGAAAVPPPYSPQ